MVLSSSYIFRVYLQETLRVKDEELQNLARDMRAKNSTIIDLAGKLSATTEAAKSVASAVHAVDQEQKIAFAEIERLTKDYEKQLNFYKLKVVRDLEIQLRWFIGSHDSCYMLMMLILFMHSSKNRKRRHCPLIEKDKN